MNSTFFKRMLSLFFLLQVVSSCLISKTHGVNDKPVTYRLTVVRILPEDDSNFIKVAFDKSQRIYKLDKNANPAYLNLLKQSLLDKTPVMIQRVNEQSDIITDVEKATDK